MAPPNCNDSVELDSEQQYDNTPSEKENHDRPVDGGAGSGSTVARDASVTLASGVLVLLLNTGIAAATAWPLGPSGRGELALALIFAQVLVLGLGFGVEMGCAYCAGREPRRLPMILGTQIVSFAVTTLLIALCGWAALHSNLSIIQKVPHAALLWGIGFAVAQLLFSFTTVLAMGLGRLRAYNTARILNRAVALVVLLVVCGLSPSSGSAVFGYACGALLPAVGLAAVLYRRAEPPRVVFAWQNVRECYRYGLRYYFGKLASLFDVHVGVMILGFIGTTEQTGLFSAALGLGTQLWILPETLNIVLLPRVLRGQAATAQLVERSCRMGLIAMIAGAVLLALLSRPIVAILLSPKFLPAVPVLLILLPGMVMGAVTRILISYFNGMGRPEFSSATLVTGLVLNTGLMLALLPRFGSIGAALATATACTVEALLAAFLYARVSGHGMRTLVPGTADVEALVTLAKNQWPARGRPGDKREDGR